jgi:uncharacterized membrane protein YbhN (UPF0104 family)
MRRIRQTLAAIEHRPPLVLGVAATAVFAAALGLAARVGFDRVEHAVTHVHPIWLLVCLGGEVLAYLGYVLAVRDTARVDDGPELGLSLSTKTVVAGFGVFSATRSNGGFAVDYWMLRRAGEERDGAIARVLALGALEYAVLAPAALGAALALLAERNTGVSEGLTLPWLLVIPGAVAAIWITMPDRAGRLVSTSARGRLRRGLVHAVGGLTMLRSLAMSPRRHGLGFVGAAGYWFGDIACLWAALQLYSGRLSIPALIVGYATGYVLTRRSLPAGGAGLVEVALTFALHWVGLPLVSALLGVLVYRLFNFWLPLLPAAAVLPDVRRLREELQAAEEAVTSV